jgi:hypothetical protein
MRMPSLIQVVKLFGLAVKESLNYGNEADIQGCVEGVFIDAIFIANKII